jgi:hypothetical protein
MKIGINHIAEMKTPKSKWPYGSFKHPHIKVTEDQAKTPLQTNPHRNTIAALSKTQKGSSALIQYPQQKKNRPKPPLFYFGIEHLKTWTPSTKSNPSSA